MTQRIDIAEVIEVIHVVSLRGKGVASDDPVRQIDQYWSKDGRLLAEKDDLVRITAVDASSPKTS